MHSNIEKLYASIDDLFSKEEFLKEIEKRKKEVDGLLDDESIALLILDEMGRHKKHITAISDLKENEECTVFGKVIAIDKPVEFSRQNGSKGRVVNLSIKDNTGCCTLVLWDDDVDLVGDAIQIGTMVKVVNGYTKRRNNEIEINVGKWGSIEIEPEDAPKIVEKDENLIEGTLIKKEPTRAFFNDDGEFDFVRDIWLKTSEETKKITVWGEHTKTIQSINVGETILIRDFYKKNGDIHVNSHSTITTKS